MQQICTLTQSFDMLCRLQVQITLMELGSITCSNIIFLTVLKILAILGIIYILYLLPPFTLINYILRMRICSHAFLIFQRSNHKLGGEKALMNGF